MGPMKLGIMNLFINIFLNSFFGVKFKAFINKDFLMILLTNRNSSSRDNSIIIIKVLIGITVYDLDVELNILMCSSFLILVCSTNEYLHDLSLNRRKSDWFLSSKKNISN